MPAHSPEQQRLFGMALSQKRGKAHGARKKVRDLAKRLSQATLKDFAATPHSQIKEARLLSFAQFVMESEDFEGAYVNPEGELKNLKFTKDEETEITSFDTIQSLKDFFETMGAEEVRYKIKDQYLGFRFSYSGLSLSLVFDLEKDKVLLRDLETETIMYNGTTDSLIDLIKSEGFDFMTHGQ